MYAFVHDIFFYIYNTFILKILLNGSVSWFPQKNETLLGSCDAEFKYAIRGIILIFSLWNVYILKSIPIALIIITIELKTVYCVFNQISITFQTSKLLNFYCHGFLLTCCWSFCPTLFIYLFILSKWIIFHVDGLPHHHCPHQGYRMLMLIYIFACSILGRIGRQQFGDRNGLASSVLQHQQPWLWRFLWLMLLFAEFTLRRIF